MSNLTGKVVIVTGASRGIGAAAAVALAKQGATVMLTARDGKLAGDVAQSIVAAGGIASARACDVSDYKAVEGLVAETIGRFGRLDVLHNNAGGSTSRDGLVTEADLTEFWRVIGVDLFGMILGCRFGIPQMIKSGGG